MLIHSVSIHSSIPFIYLFFHSCFISYVTIYLFIFGLQQLGNGKWPWVQLSQWQFRTQGIWWVFVSLGAEKFDRHSRGDLLPSLQFFLCYTSLPSSRNTFFRPFKEKCKSEVVRIGGIIIFHPSKLLKAKFFLLCGVIFLVRLQAKLEIDHSLEWRVISLLIFSHPWIKLSPPCISLWEHGSCCGWSQLF